MAEQVLLVLKANPFKHFGQLWELQHWWGVRGGGGVLKGGGCYNRQLISQNTNGPKARTDIA